MATANQRRAAPGPLASFQDRWPFFFAAAGLLALITLLSCLSFDSLAWANFLYEFLLDGGVFLLWLLAAAGLGSLVPLDAAVPRKLRWVIAAALGLGAMSLLELAAGLSGATGRATGFIILIAGLACFARAVLRERRRAPLAIDPPGPRWLLLAAIPIATLTTLAAFVPPGILWGDEPHGYDVLEYHLQVPREWFELGRIVPLHHNVFSFLPFNVEMHFLLAMQLRGGPWEGMFLAQLMHSGFMLLTAAALYALCEQRSRLGAAIAATSFLTLPWIGLLAPVAYDEGGMLLFGTLAVGLLLRSRSLRDAALAGAMAGLACGSKLTAVPLFAIALPLLWFLFTRRFRLLAVYLITTLLLFSPWLVRNAVWSGNPVFPEAGNLLGRAHWTPVQVDRWRDSLLPRPDQRNIAGYLRADTNQILFDWRFGFALIPLALCASWFQRRTTEARVLLLLLLVTAIFWTFFTHLQSRFFTPAIPLLCLLLGSVRWRPAAALAVIAAIAWTGCVYAKLINLPPGPHLFDFLGNEQLISLTPLTDKEVPPDQHVVLIGDARAFLYSIPSRQLEYRTVFDVDAKPGESVLDAWQSHPNEHALRIVAPDELERFSKTYLGIPPPPPQLLADPTPHILSP